MEIGEGYLLVKCNKRSFYSLMSSVFPIHYKIFEFPELGRQRERSASITQTTVYTGSCRLLVLGTGTSVGTLATAMAVRKKQPLTREPPVFCQNPENLEAHL